MDVRDHGWFVFMAPRDNPVIAGVIFAEHAEHGYYGASIAKHIIETYYAKIEGKPLPQLEKPPVGNDRGRSPRRRPAGPRALRAPAGAAEITEPCSNAGCFSTSTGRCSPPSW